MVEPKNVHSTKTEFVKLVEDQGEGEAKDETKQDSNEEKNDATMDVEETDIRMPALESLGLRDSVVVPGNPMNVDRLAGMCHNCEHIRHIALEFPYAAKTHRKSSKGASRQRFE